MRPTLALSALLLLLLSPPSLSQSNAPRPLLSSVVSPESPECERLNCYQVSNLPIPKLQAHTDRDTNSTTSRTTTDQSHQNPPAATTISTSTKRIVGDTTTPATLSSAQPNTTQSKDSINPVQSLTSTPISSTTGSMNNQSGGGPTPTINSTQDDKTKTTFPSTSVPPSSSGHTVSSGGNSSDNVTRAPPSTMGSNQLSSNSSSQPTGLFISTTLPLTTTVSPGQSMATPSQSTENHPGRPHSPTTVPSSSASLASINISVPSRKPSTQVPPGTTEGTQATTSQVPGVPTQTFSTPLQPAESPVGTQVMTTTEELTHSSSDLTPVAPHGPSTPSPIWTFGHYKLKCDPAVMPDEELLILNLTRASLCERSPPDEKLVELLCHSVKASFKPAQDQCTIEMAPILERQAVAVKRVIIETRLPPKTVFELLKDKWDDLREAGVSDMMLGKEGPPEANEDRFSLPLIITIVCMASFLLLVAALYGCCHQRVSQRKDQQRLTEELQTVENGYHDNPTLEVMETPSEMQEKKVVSLNGELGDSWIVPLDNLTKDDLDEEEDTHL